MPGNWINRGSNIKYGIELLEEIHKLSKIAYVLYDPTPFKFPCKHLSLPNVGEVDTKFGMKELIYDRTSYDEPGTHLPHGCNVWFQF